MSSFHTTKADRAWRARRLIMPIKVRVRQPDGTYQAQWVEVFVKSENRKSKGW